MYCAQQHLLLYRGIASLQHSYCPLFAASPSFAMTGLIVFFVILSPAVIFAWDQILS